jgi:hypothetical protein
MKKFLLLFPVVLLIAAGCNKITTTNQNTQTSTETQTQANAPTVQTYNNLGYSFDYPLNWEVRNNDPSGTKFDVTVADKKYGNALEFPGLSIDVSVTGEFKKARIVRNFSESDAVNGVVQIAFVENAQKIYASCSLYKDMSVIDTCNQILDSFKATK